jgi:hypothetical protein
MKLMNFPTSISKVGNNKVKRVGEYSIRVGEDSTRQVRSRTEKTFLTKNESYQELRYEDIYKREQLTSEGNV